MRHRPSSRWLHWLWHPAVLGVSSVILILIGLFWLTVTFGPVLAVEVRYQYRATLRQVFGASDIREVILPQVDWDFQGGSQHRQYGIAIPKIFLDEPVIFNVDPNQPEQYQAALKQGIAHASSTAFPDSGGIGYYFAHSSSPDLHRQYNAVFYTLGKLNPGDAVYIWFEDHKYRYEVTDTVITDPQDVSFLNQEYPEETIVLQTCWPPGTTAKRLLVFAQRREINE